MRPLLFLLYFLENKLIGYKLTLGRVNEWCHHWGMKFNETKTKTIRVSGSCTTNPQSPSLTIGGTGMKESDDLVILGVTFDTKMTFEKKSSLGLESSFSSTWYFEEDLASIP